MQPLRVSFSMGLFLATLATLALEILDTRLLSVVTWYHLSFFAVSTALFGMSAGSLRVYLGGERYAPSRAPAELARSGDALRPVDPGLPRRQRWRVPIPPDLTATSVAALATLTGAIAVPFYLSGVLVALALTRIPGPSGRVYAVDLARRRARQRVRARAARRAPTSPRPPIAVGALAAVVRGLLPRLRRAIAAARARRAALALGLALARRRQRAARPPRAAHRVLQERRVAAQRASSTSAGRSTDRSACAGPPIGRPSYWGAGAGTDGYRVEPHPAPDRRRAPPP